MFSLRDPSSAHIVADLPNNRLTVVRFLKQNKYTDLLAKA